MIANIEQWQAIPDDKERSERNRTELVYISNGKACKDPILTGAYKGEVKVDLFAGTAETLITNPQTGLTYTLGICKNLTSLSPIVFKFIATVTHQYYLKRQQQFYFSLDDCIKCYMLCGVAEKADITNQRKAVIKYFPAIRSIGIDSFKEIRTRTGKGKKKEVTYDGINFFQHLRYKKGIVDVELTNDFMHYLAETGFMKSPKELLGIDNRDQTSIELGIKLSAYNGSNKNKIRVTKLLEATPNLPKKEDLKQNKPKRYIQTPFLESLAKLKNSKVILDYQFMDSEKKQYKLEAVEAMTYDKFEKLFMTYTLNV